MFGKKLSFYMCKDYFMTHVKALDYHVTVDSENCFVVEIANGSRKINVTLTSYKRGKVSIDITDSYGILRIPKYETSKFDDFKVAIINSCSKILSEVNK